MCFSFTTSLIAYILGLGAAITAFLTKQFALGGLILFFVQVQLGEALIWRGIDTNKTEPNKVGTAYVKYTLPSHNIGLALGLLIAILVAQQRSLVLTDYIPLIIAVLFYIAIVTLYGKTPGGQLTWPANKNCQSVSCQNWKARLIWPFPSGWYIISFLISISFLWLVYDGPFASKVFLSSSFAVLLLLTFAVWPYATGTTWCLAAAVAAPVIVLINYFLIDY